MKINPNDPAFPACNEANMNGTMGLTIRDHIATQAMQGIVSSIDSEDNYERLRQHASHYGLKVSQWIARESCKQADALIAELNKEATK